MVKRSVFILAFTALFILGSLNVFAQEPTDEPTVEPTTPPTEEPTVEPTDEMTPEPTVDITVEPTTDITAEPTEDMTAQPPTEVPVEMTPESTDSPMATSEATIQPGQKPDMGNMPMDMMMDMMMKEAVASTEMMDVDGNRVGNVWFFEFDEDEADGKVFVVARVMDMPEGFHGFHVHAVGSCEDNGDGPFTAAGGHFNPTDSPHDDHAGDLPALLVAADGMGYLVTATDRFTVDDLFDEDGTALIVHGNADNHANIPERHGGPDEETLKAGDSGPRLACGIVEEGAMMMER